MTAMHGRPLPSVTEQDTGEFWAANADGRLTYQVCRTCERVVFFPRSHCPHCGGLDLDVRDAAGAGTIYTFTVVRTHADPFFKARLPYVTALVDLPEGVRIMTEIVGIDPDAVRVGQAVTLEWEAHDGLALPLFRPTD
jgi:uncharacterized OB-fold protein